MEMTVEKGGAVEAACTLRYDRQLLKVGKTFRYYAKRGNHVFAIVAETLDYKQGD